MKNTMAVLLLMGFCHLFSFAGGDGSAADPWQIAAPAHLDEVRNYLGSVHSDKYYILINDIDLDIAPYNSGDGWLPIGNAGNQFAGNLNGNSLNVENLYINRPDNWYIALFGYAHSEANIENLTLLAADVTGYSWVGGLVGYNLGAITNCGIEGNVSAGSRIGGLVGRNLGTIDNCYSSGSVTALTGNDCGGLAGRNYDGIIMNSHSFSTVTGYGNNSYGGLVGWNDSDIENCYATGNVTGNLYCGGLVGRNYDGTVSNSFAAGNVVSNTNSIGGLVGLNGGLPSLHNPVIINCYATGDVQGDSSIGGLAGENSNLISNSYATGSVWGSNASTYQFGVGGLVGQLNQNAVIEYCYAVGDVSGNPPIGGLVGHNSNGIVNFSYWNYETSNQNTSAGGIGLNINQMLLASSFQYWDFAEVWQNMENITYPYLRDNPQDPPPAPPIPIIIVSPAAFSLIVDPDTITEEPMFIQNAGTVDLTFDIYIDEIPRERSDFSTNREEWLSISPQSGIVAPGENCEITVVFDASVVAPGEVYSAEIIIVNNAGDPVIVAVSMEVTLPFLPPPENLQVNEINGFFSWDEPVYGSLILLHYNIFLDDELTATTISTGFQFEDLINGQSYTAGVSAEYDLGESMVAAVDFVFQGVSADDSLPMTIFNLTNHPNPFNPSTTITFSLTTKNTSLRNATPQQANSHELPRIEIFNLKGQKVKVLECCNSFAANAKNSLSTYSVIWDGSDDSGKPVSSGVYYVFFRSGGFQGSRKIMLLK